MRRNGANELEQKKKAVQDCIDQFGLPDNPAITDKALALDGFPNRPSKTLAFLILTYQREATTTELKQISDQPAALIRTLRKRGFIFQDNGKTPPKYLYLDDDGETCRKIIGYQTPRAEVKGKVKAIIEKSVAACISAIEVYNKPDFKYREETFSILLVNAWELLLKAKLLFDNNNQISSIQATGNDGKVKKNRSGNPLTIEIRHAIERLANHKELDVRCRSNIELLIEIRDNAIHYINKRADFSKKVQEIGTASLRNYITAINEWFDVDLTQYNFYLMPMSFFHPIEMDSFSVGKPDKEVARMLAYFQTVETDYPSNEDSAYNVALQIKTKFVKSSTDTSVLEVRYTDREGAPEVKVSEESIIETKYTLSYNDLTAKLHARYTDFKQNKEFHAIKRDLEGPNKYGERFCKIRYLNVKKKKGSKKYYSTEILKEFDKHYTRRKK